MAPSRLVRLESLAQNQEAVTGATGGSTIKSARRDVRGLSGKTWSGEQTLRCPLQWRSRVPRRAGTRSKASRTPPGASMTSRIESASGCRVKVRKAQHSRSRRTISFTRSAAAGKKVNSSRRLSRCRSRRASRFSAAIQAKRWRKSPELHATQAAWLRRWSSPLQTVHNCLSLG